MRAIRIILVGVTGLAIGFGLARLLGSQSARGPVEEKTYKAKAKIADEGESATVAALRTRIAQLEKALAERVAQVEEARTNAVAEAEAGRHRGDPRKFFEELKVKDPERYAQITNRMAQWRQHQVERAQTKLDFLASVDTSRMGSRARTVHEELQEAIVSHDELEQKLQDPNLGEEERRELFQKLHESHGRLADLNRQERNNLLNETARELGFKGEEAKTITATIKNVIDATDSGWGGPGRGHGRGRGGPPPGGPR